MDGLVGVGMRTLIQSKQVISRRNGHPALTIDDMDIDARIHDHNCYKNIIKFDNTVKQVTLDMIQTYLNQT